MSNRGPSNDRPAFSASAESGPPRVASRSRPWGWAAVADIRAGEQGLVLTATLSLAGIVAAHVAAETARDALFLSQLKPHFLAFVYLAMAVFSALLGRFGHAVERTLGRSNALILSLMMASVGNTLFFVADKTHAITFAYYLWVGLSGTLLLLQFWLFAADRFSGQQGRRLFGLIAAGGVLGAVAGGAISTAVTEWLQVSALQAVAAGLQLIAAMVVTTAPEGQGSIETGRAASWSQSLSELRKDGYVRRICWLVFVSTATLVFVDFVFKSVTADNIPPAELAQFLAVYYTATNAAALLIQVFIAMRVLQRAGTIFALTLLPLGLLLSAGAPFFLGGIFSAALLTKGVDGALRHSLHRVSTELLYLPLSSSLRYSAKSLIESLVTRGTQGLAALSLLALSSVGWATNSILLSIVAGGALVWFALAVSMRRPYLAQFRSSMGRRAGLPEFRLDQLTLDGVEVIIESLSSPEEGEVLSAMSVLERAGRTGLIPALLLYHPSPRVVARGLALIPSKQRRDWPALAERLVAHESEELRLAAVTALGRFGYLDKLDPAKLSSPPLAATAAFFRGDQLASPLDDPIVAQLHEKTASPTGQAALLQAISKHGSSRWSESLLLLQTVVSPDASPALTEAMAKVRDARFVSYLVPKLDDPGQYSRVKMALAAIGTPGLVGLREAMCSEASPLSLRLRIPGAVAQFHSQKAADFLIECLQATIPGAVRYKVLRALGHLAEKVPLRFSEAHLLPVLEQNGKEALRNRLFAELIEEGLSDGTPQAKASGQLLVALLRDKHNQSLERITRLLQLLHRRENLKQVYQALLSNDDRAKGAAAELVEVITLGYREELREVLRTVCDPATDPGRQAHILDVLQLSVNSTLDALRTILKDPDPALSALAADYSSRREFLEVAVEVQQVLSENPWLNPTTETTNQEPF